MQTSIVEKILAGILFIFALPLFALLWILMQIEDKGPLFFRQRRLGKDKKPFTIYKIRTMVVGAEKLRGKYKGLNEADTPVFKIYNDPRYTRLGKFLAHTGLDELPQLINIIKGDMKFVGPRPLPGYEAKRVPRKYWARFSVYPGITSLWIVRGAHNLSFKRWMELDLEQIKRRNLMGELAIAVGTVKIIVFSLGRVLKKYLWLLAALAIISVGFYLRWKLVVGKILWGDELLYFDNGVSTSFRDLITQNYFIVDNPPFFSIFLKIWSLASKEIVWLRVPGLLIYLVSSGLLLLIFKKAASAIKLFILFLFCLSPYFSNINSWISPYNFLLLFSLIQIALIEKLLVGDYSKKPLSFIILLSLLNFLLFVTHYASIYFFSGYVFLLAYLFWKKKSTFRIFRLSLGVSFILLLPVLYLLFRKYNEITSLLGIKWPLIFSSPFDAYLYIVRRSIFRIRDWDFTFLATIAFPLILLIRKFNRYFLYFIAFFIVPVTLLYFLNQVHPAIANERAYFVFHLGFYFFLGGALVAAKKTNRVIYISFFLISTLALTRTYIFPTNEGLLGYFPGNVITQRLERNDYQKFIGRVKLSLEEGNYDCILLVERDRIQIQEKQIFYMYYFSHSNDFSDFRRGFKLDENLFYFDTLESGIPKGIQGFMGKKILVINFEETSIEDLLLKSAIKEKTDVINYWEYFLSK